MTSVSVESVQKRGCGDVDEVYIAVQISEMMANLIKQQ